MSNTVRFGILGTARIATKVARAIQASTGGELHAIASRDAEHATEWARRHEVPQCFGSYEALLDAPEIDAVYVPLPPALHCEWTTRAAAKGKHVLCEKPLSISVGEAERMVEACRENNVQLMDATMWLHTPREADMARHVRSGELGEPRRVTAAVGIELESYLRNNPPRTPPGANPHQHELRLQRDLGGGALMDVGWYCIGAAQWVFRDLPTRVFGTARYQGEVDMSFSGMLWYEGERMASFDCGFDIARRKWFEIAGTQGSLVCDDFVGPWDVQKQRFWTHDAEARPSEHVSEPAQQELCMIERFCQAVSSGKKETSWVNRSLDTQRICAALERSAREDRVVELPR